MNSVVYEQHDGIARIRLCHGNKGNSLPQTTVDALFRAVRRARSDDVHVVVVSSEGRSSYFSGDVSAFAAAEDLSSSSTTSPKACTAWSASCIG